MPNTEPDNDFDLSDFTATWQAESGPELEALKASVERWALWSRYAFVIECSVALIGIAIGCWALWGGAVVPGSAAIAFALYGGVAAYYARRQTWLSSAGPVVKQTEVLAEQVKAQERSAWIGISVSIAAIVFLSVLLGAANTSPDTGLTNHILAGALIFIAIGIGVSVRGVVVARRRRQALEDLMASYQDPLF